MSSPKLEDVPTPAPTDATAIPSQDAPPENLAVQSPAHEITVHFLLDSRAQRIMFLLEELEVLYLIKPYKRTAVGLAPPELYDVHPLGKSPVITDETTGRTMAESELIVEYLVTKYGKGKIWVPSFVDDQDAWISNQYFTHFAEATVQPRLVNRRIFSETVIKSPTVLRPIVRGIMKKLDSIMVAPELKRQGELIESHLAQCKKASDGSLWFAGGELPTTADFMMFFTLELLIARSPQDVGKITKQWVKDIQSRPSYQRGLEKTGTYQYMVAA